MLEQQSRKLSSYRESLKSLEADIQHANSLAASLPRSYGEECVQMRLSYSPIAPFILFLVEWMDYSCTDALPSYLGLLHVLVYKVYLDETPCFSSKERKASLREFYAVIYPSLRQLEAEVNESEGNRKRRRVGTEVLRRKKAEDRVRQSDSDLEAEDECGICMEGSSKMVLPDCAHTMCISCFRDWNVKSESCPFCRGSLKRVSSRDLWVMISTSDVLDTIALAKENLRQFYVYIDNLPPAIPNTHSFLIDYMI